MKNLSKNPKTLQFEIVSGKLNITDPCYDTNTTCALFNLPAVNGVWSVTGEYEDGKSWGYRIASILAVLNDISLYNFDLKELSDNIGVDSGQCGIFDAGKYPQNEVEAGDYDDKSSFYGKVCDLTHNEEEHEVNKSTPYFTYGIVDNFGVASSSGYGDGCYTAYGAKNENGELVAVKIVFLEEEIDEEEDDDDRCPDCGEYEYNCSCDDVNEEDDEE